jgi:hypothetical protein
VACAGDGTVSIRYKVRYTSHDVYHTTEREAGAERLVGATHLYFPLYPLMRLRVYQ